MQLKNQTLFIAFLLIGILITISSVYFSMLQPIKSDCNVRLKIKTK